MRRVILPSYRRLNPDAKWPLRYYEWDVVNGERGLRQPCSDYIVCMQYTLRTVPAGLDRALRRLARREGRSRNEVTLAALSRAVGADEEPVP